MKLKRKILVRFVVVALLLGIYPMGVLIYTWSCVFQSDLQGGRHGPLDAYRHALASAVVSYTLDERAVSLITWVMESRGRDSNEMDSRNNRVGARIGARAESFREIEPAVRQSVLEGAANSTDANTITWLPKEKWREGRIW